MKDIILVGFGGHAKSIADSIEQVGNFHIVGYVDIEPRGIYKNYCWLGTDDELKVYYKSGIHNAVICMGYMGDSDIRDKLYSLTKDIGFDLPVIIDASAVIAEDVQIGEGTYIGKGAIINADSRIGKMCIVNSGVLIEHESNIEDYSHIAVRTVICGNVRIGEHTFIGANTTVIQGINIGERCIVGAGSTILKDIPEQKKVYGVYHGIGK